ncbi:MAG: UvrD-helicase domain-containing protein [Clostridia bacterium]|nr:UvrD-helicase domain-containing protein [Clostridia bacterium]
MPTFNPDQVKAIEAENPSILVSAAAGSGKTTVMVEKIRHTLQVHPEKHLSNMLVITFTREAAANMRLKLQELLSEAANQGDATAAQALSEIEAAQISTIHAFCAQAVRDGFHIVDVDPMFRIAEAAETEYLFQSAFQSAVDALLSQEQGADAADRLLVRDLLATFSQKELLDMTRTVYQTLMGLPDGFVLLRTAVDAMLKTPSAHPWVQEIMQATRLDLRMLPSLMAREQELVQDPIAPVRCLDVAEADKACLEGILEQADAVSDPEALCAIILGAKDAMPGLTLRKLSDAEKAWYEAFKSLRQEIKGSSGLLATAAQRLQAITDEKALRDNQRIQEEARGLYTLTQAVARFFREEKRNANVVDFSDLEQMTYTLMTDAQHTEVRTSMLEAYTDIYVDECQDVSAIQNAIIQSLNGENHHLFMVGDIKQSIYRFRHADPGLFLGYRDSFADADAARERKIFFRDNYRSSAAVIDCVNATFEKCMVRQVSELDYEEGDRLIANKPGNFGPVTVCLLDRDAQQSETEDKTDLLEAQCLEAARCIDDWVQGREREGTPAYHYGDIAILLRSVKTDAPKIVEAFRKLHIPVSYEGVQNYYSLPEVSSFLALLRVIDNMHQDIPLIATLAHQPFSFSEEALARIRLYKPEQVPFYEAFDACCQDSSSALGIRCLRCRKVLERWRFEAGTRTASDLIWQLLRETSLYALYGAYPDGKRRQRNLDALYQRAVDLEERGILTLSDFLDEIHRNEESTQSAGGSAFEEGGEDAVRIMTMHKSKGLEFRCVILMNLQRNIRARHGTNTLLLDLSPAHTERPSLGMYLPAIRRGAHTIADTYGKDAFDARRIRDEIAESTRLLYVAMTRAMERLVMIGTFREKDAELWQEKDACSRVWKTRSMLDMVMPSVLQGAPMPPVGEAYGAGNWLLKVTVPENLAEDTQDAGQAGREEELVEMAAASGDSYESLFLPPHEDAWPAKTSVTALVRGTFREWSDAEDRENETVENKRMDRPLIAQARLSEEAEKPAFLEEQKASAAEAGSMTHRFLRLISLPALRTAQNLDATIREEAQRMRESGILGEKEAGVLRLDSVAAFFRSPLGQRFLQAQESHREWKFLYETEDAGHLLIEGIIDAAFLEADGWVLIDYKTDHDTRPEQLIARHAEQMNWYRRALEQLSRKPVKEMWLYALRSHSACQVPVRDVSIRRA